MTNQALVINSSNLNLFKVERIKEVKRRKNNKEIGYKENRNINR